ncbi:MAG: GNAT family N-acetyltransferase [Ktedonobacterales bacterium]
MEPFESARLRFREATPDDLPASLAIYLSNPEYVMQNEGSAGEPGHYDMEMLQRDWWVLQMMPGSHILALTLKDTGALVGRVDYFEEHDDGYPWLGVLLLDAAYQRRGLGREAFARLAGYFRATYGWPRLRLSVRVPNTGALAFWRRMGFQPAREDETEDASREWITLERAL